MNKELQKAITRLVVAAVLLVNAYLSAKGTSPLPFDDTAAGEFVSQALAAVSCIWVWWKNNNVTTAAVKAQEVTRAIKEDGINELEEEDEDEE